MSKRSAQRFVYEPDYATPPGATLQETIELLGMTQAQLATRTGLSKKTINQIIQGHEPISHETALRLERVTGVPAHFWNDRELRYRERLAKKSSLQDLEKSKGWLDVLPIREMKKSLLLPKTKDPAKLSDSALHFFGVGSPAEFSAIWTSPAADYRKSPAFLSNPGAVAVWLRKAELEAAKMELPPFRRDLLKSKLDELRSLSLEKPIAYLRKLVQICSECGVALVYVPEIKSCHVSGAARWLTSTKPMIVLSLRFKKDDQFWFSLFHEIAHILKHGKKQVFIDGDKGSERVAEELEADLFARHHLIPPAFEQDLQQLETADDIVKFAKRIGIAKGVIVGRLQRDRKNFTVFNKLKETVDFSVVAASLRTGVYR